MKKLLILAIFPILMLSSTGCCRPWLRHGQLSSHCATCDAQPVPTEFSLPTEIEVLPPVQ